MAMAWVAVAWMVAAVAPQVGGRSELIWTRPVHREETAAVEGLCPRCGRPLEGAPVTIVWRRPLHALHGLAR